MSQEIVREVIFLGHALLLGIMITFVYDWFLIARRLIKHNILLISLEDFIFWIFCAISMFVMLYRENSGTLRWFAVAGACLGMLLYKKTVSHFLIRTVSRILQKLLQLLRRFLSIFIKPVSIAANKGKQGCFRVKSEGRKLSKYIKNRLTACKKVLKIILCKR